MQIRRRNFSRKNGCTWPWHPYQVLSWLIGSFTVFEVAVFIAALLPPAYQVPHKQAIYAVLLSLFLLTVVILTVILTFIDPTDSIVQQCRKAKEQK
jgi:hypothetical protein